MNYRAELNQLIIVANNMLKRKNQHWELLTNKMGNSGYKIYYQLRGGSPEVELSPRMSIKNLCNWLDGFISGLEF